MKKSALFVKLSAILCFMWFVQTPLEAQFLRTSYFMDSAPYRTDMNPALTPPRGFLSIPVIGHINASVNSNTLGAKDVVDIVKNGNDFYNNQDFLNRLKDQNRLNVALSLDVCSFGFYKGKGFWTFNITPKVDAGAVVRKTMFDFLHESSQDNFEWENTKYDIGTQKLNVNAYTEVGVGYARPLTNRLTIGAKVKLLLGMANVKLQVDKISMEAELPKEAEVNTIVPSDLSKYYAKMSVRATMESSLKGLELKEQDDADDAYIDGIKMNGFGVAGYGAALDLGASYKWDNFTLSGSVLDLGFINWSKNSANIATASQDLDYEGKDYSQTESGVIQFKQDIEDFYDRTDGGKVLDYNMLQLKKEEGKARHTALHSSMVLGAKYALNKSVSFGVLSTTRYIQPKTQTEFTMSANYCPKNWFNASLSYSLIQSAGKSFGVAMKLGPLFVGTDYMYLGNNTKAANAYLGISFYL